MSDYADLIKRAEPYYNALPVEGMKFLDAVLNTIRDLAIERDEIQSQLEEVRNAGNQALRQWKMYAEMMDGPDDFEKSGEGSVYRSCKAALSGEDGKPSVGAQIEGAASVNSDAREPASAISSAYREESK